MGSGNRKPQSPRKGTRVPRPHPGCRQHSKTTLRLRSVARRPPQAQQNACAVDWYIPGPSLFVNCQQKAKPRAHRKTHARDHQPCGTQARCRSVQARSSGRHVVAGACRDRRTKQLVFEIRLRDTANDISERHPARQQPGTTAPPVGGSHGSVLSPPSAEPGRPAVSCHSVRLTTQPRDLFSKSARLASSRAMSLGCRPRKARMAPPA